MNAEAAAGVTHDAEDVADPRRPGPEIVQLLVRSPHRGLSALLAELVTGTGRVDAGSPWSLLDLSLLLDELWRAWRHHARLERALIERVLPDWNDLRDGQCELLRATDDLRSRTSSLITGVDGADRPYLVHDLHLRMARLAARAWQRFSHVESALAAPLALRLAEPGVLERVAGVLLFIDESDPEASRLLGRWTRVGTGSPPQPGLAALLGRYAKGTDAAYAIPKGVSCH